jgi:hypothetical protein
MMERKERKIWNSNTDSRENRETEEIRNVQLPQTKKKLNIMRFSKNEERIFSLL